MVCFVFSDRQLKSNETSWNQASLPDKVKLLASEYGTEM